MHLQTWSVGTNSDVKFSFNMVSFLIIAALAAAVTASFEGNINYDSPSSNHAGLGINLPKVRARHLEKRDYTGWNTSSLNFTHGVASVWL